MITKPAVWVTCVILSAVWVCGCLGVCEAAPPAEPIPEAEITAIETELAQGMRGPSLTHIRRACKSVVRRAAALLDASPEAPNRFAVLAVAFEGQKRLLRLESTERNRKAIYETAGKLLEAPDEYAETRLEADLLLSERALATASAAAEERVKALEGIIEKYRDTSAERQCLRVARLIASELRAFALELEIQKRLANDRFAGDHDIIALRPLANLNAVFSGTYESADKAPVKFPSDRLGHQYLVTFWSTDGKGSEGHETFLTRIKEQQERFSGRFEVYSFNLDDMPDAGKSILSRSGVKGTALHLPGGRRHSAYQAYARMDPVAILVNAQGHASSNARQTAPRSANPGSGLGMWLDDARYVAQLRSLFVGDFLVSGVGGSASAKATADERVSGVDMGPIQSCFALPPFRYRLTRKEELANYRKAEKLCGEMLRQAQHDEVGEQTAPDESSRAESRDLTDVRNRRIIALIGMWNLAREPKHLEAAVKEAKAMLATELPPGAGVVARFCLVKDALWREGAIPKVLLGDLIDAEGGGKAPARALAAAAVLAIEANAEALYQDYRQQLLGLSDEEHPGLWPVLSLIRDRHHNHRLFWGNPGRWGYGKLQKYRARYVISGVGAPDEAGLVPVATLKDLDGRDVRIPQDLAGKMAGIVFVEPSAEASSRAVCVKRLKDFTGQFSKRDVPVIAAFLSEDTETVKSMIEDCGGSFRAAMVPGGLANPLVRRLGILSADRIPNPFLIHGDGAIAWWVSGLTYAVSQTPMEYAVSVSIGINIEKLRTDRAFQALEQGDFKKALVLFSERLPPKFDADWWTADRLQARALAYTGLNDWKAALTDIDAAMSDREKASEHRRAISMGDAEMRFAKSTILKALGRDEEAEKERTIGEEYLAWLGNNPDGGYGANPPTYARGGVPVGVYDDRLKRIRLALSGEGK